MSADIAVIHNDELDDPGMVPVGWYVAVLDHDGAALELVGPYASHDLACRKMTTAGGAVWLHGDHAATRFVWGEGASIGPPGFYPE